MRNPNKAEAPYTQGKLKYMQMILIWKDVLQKEVKNTDAKIFQKLESTEPGNKTQSSLLNTQRDY